MAQRGALTGSYRPTSRNALVKAFYPRLGFELTGTADGGEENYRLDFTGISAEKSVMAVSAVHS